MATPQPTATRRSQLQKSLMGSPVARDGKHRQKKKGYICPICTFAMGYVTHSCTVSVQDLSKTAFASLPGPDIGFFAVIVTYLNMKHCYLN